MLAKKLSMTLKLDGVPRYFCTRYCPPMVVSYNFYNTFVLVRGSGLCLFAEKNLQRINQNLAKANSIKASGL